MNKKVVYTAIYGDKDVLKDPLFINKDFDYLCFTDNKNLQSKVWKIIIREATHKDPVRCARELKIKPHEFVSKYDTSIWVDANFLICHDLNDFLSMFSYHANILTFQHDQGRNCIYEEAKAVILLKKDDPEVVEKQMKKYREEEYPENLGLTTTSVLARRHNEKDIVELSNLWWSQINTFSRRDQLSFYYSKWKTKTKILMLRYPNYNIRHNKWFRWLPHNYETQTWSF